MERFSEPRSPARHHRLVGKQLTRISNQEKGFATEGGRASIAGGQTRGRGFCASKRLLNIGASTWVGLIRTRSSTCRAMESLTSRSAQKEMIQSQRKTKQNIMRHSVGEPPRGSRAGRRAQRGPEGSSPGAALQTAGWRASGTRERKVRGHGSAADHDDVPLTTAFVVLFADLQVTQCKLGQNLEERDINNGEHEAHSPVHAFPVAFFPLMLPEITKRGRDTCCFTTCVSRLSHDATAL